MKIPNEYKRQFNRLAGMLELIDEEFSRLRNVLTDYRRQMLALEASGQLDEVDLNSDTFRRYLDMHPFARLNQRIAAINQAELYPVPLMPFLRVFQKLGLETLGDVNRLIDEHSDDAYRLAASQLGATDLDILSESIAPQNLCYVYVLKQGGGLKELCQLLDWIKGPDDGNTTIAKGLLEQVHALHFPAPPPTPSRGRERPLRDPSNSPVEDPSNSPVEDPSDSPVEDPSDSPV